MPIVDVCETYSLVIEYAQLSSIFSFLIEFKNGQHPERRETITDFQVDDSVLC